MVQSWFFLFFSFHFGNDCKGLFLLVPSKAYQGLEMVKKNDILFWSLFFLGMILAAFAWGFISSELSKSERPLELKHKSTNFGNLDIECAYSCDLKVAKCERYCEDDLLKELEDDLWKELFHAKEKCENKCEREYGLCVMHCQK
jgi:NAD+--asparagine ADP-ribosyltransferase